MPVQSYKELIVWQKAMDLVLEVYKISKNFPKDELYSLTNQIRRAVVSVPSNIAEGWGRNSRAEYLHFISIAKGSLAETETQLILACRLQYIDELQVKTSLSLREEVGKMLVALYSKLSSS
jgi:four helix bundle protein